MLEGTGVIAVTLESVGRVSLAKTTRVTEGACIHILHRSEFLNKHAKAILTDSSRQNVTV